MGARAPGRGAGEEDDAADLTVPVPDPWGKRKGLPVSPGLVVGVARRGSWWWTVVAVGRATRDQPCLRVRASARATGVRRAVKRRARFFQNRWHASLVVRAGKKVFGSLVWVWALNLWSCGSERCVLYLSRD